MKAVYILIFLALVLGPGAVQADSGNLVPLNPGLELGSFFYWDFASPHWQVVSNLAHAGQYSARCAPGLDTAGCQYLTDPMTPIQPGHTYRFGAWLYGSNGTNALVHFQVVYFAAGYIRLGTGPEYTQRAVSQTWTQFTHDEVVPAGAVWCVLSMWKNGPSEAFYLDDISTVEISQ